MSNKTISWSVVPITEFASHRHDWDKLNERTFNSILLRASFYEELLNAFGSGEEILAIGSIDERVVACGIFIHTGVGSWQTFQPAQAPLGAWIHDSSSQSLDRMTHDLQHALAGKCLVLGISQLDPDHCDRPPSLPTVRTLDYIETASIPIKGTFTDYWSARGRNLRHNLKRQRNRLAKESIMTRLEVVHNSEQMKECVRDYGEMESQGWKAGGGTAIHLENNQGRFYLKLLEEYGRSGNAAVCRYYFNDKLVATDMCVYDANQLVILKTTHDETQKTSSPAFLMRQEYFEQFFDTGISAKIEFYGKLMDWHTKWSTDVRRMYHVNQYRWRLLARILSR